jgi:hypothetical protein
MPQSAISLQSGTKNLVSELPSVVVLAWSRQKNVFCCLKKEKKIGGNVDEYETYRLTPLTPHPGHFTIPLKLFLSPRRADRKFLATGSFANLNF